MEKKPVIVFTIADANNLKYAQMLKKSFKYFHPNIPFHTVHDEKLRKYLSEDKDFFYRATPIIGKELLKEYDLVLKIDADSLITGSLDYVFDTKDYDVGTVINWNRIDPQRYGYVTIQGVQPPEYMNCGFVAMRSEKFVHEWKELCFSPQFDRLQYKEQDLLNFMIYYNNWNVRCFDHPDPLAKHYAWYGLISKGEWLKIIVKDNKLVVPKGEDGFPPVDTQINCIHWAGGTESKLQSLSPLGKMNYKVAFTEEVSDYIDRILK